MSITIRCTPNAVEIVCCSHSYFSPVIATNCTYDTTVLWPWHARNLKHAPYGKRRKLQQTKNINQIHIVKLAWRYNCACFNIKTFSSYGDSRHNDEAVVQPSYLYTCTRNPNTGKTASLYWIGLHKTISKTADSDMTTYCKNSQYLKSMRFASHFKPIYDFNSSPP